MTEANVMYMNEDSTIDSINVHDDGYLSHLGRMLEHNYKDTTKVRKLIDLGDVLSIGESLEQFPLIRQFGRDWNYSNNIYDRHIPDTKTGFDFKQNIWRASQHFVDARYRDHGEKFQQAHFMDLSAVYQSKDSLEVEYLFIPNDSNGGNWLYRHGDDRFQPLSLALGQVIKEE